MVAVEKRDDAVSGTRRIVLALARVVVGALVLATIIARIDLARVWSSIRDVPTTAVLEGFALWMIGWWIISYRLAILLQAQGARTRTFEALQINLAALFYSLFLPGGELAAVAVRIHRLARGSGRYTAVLLAIAIDRVASIAAVSATGLICWTLDSHDKPAAIRVAFLIGVAAVATAVALFAAWAQRRRYTGSLAAPGPRWMQASLRRLGAELDVVAHLRPRTIALLGFLSCLSQVPGILAYVVLAHALGLALSVVTLAWVRSATMVVTALPISIGGLGVREGLLLVVLRFYAVADHDALALSLLVFAVTIVGAGSVGGVFEACRLFAPRTAAGAVTIKE